MRNLYILILLIIWLTTAQLKTVSRNFRISNLQQNDKSIFLTKFDFGTDGGSIKIKAIKRQSKHQIEKRLLVDLVIDTQIQKYLAQDSCSERKKHIIRSQQFTFPVNENIDQRKMRIQPMENQHIYYLYFVLCEQAQDLSEIMANEDEQTVFEIIMLNGESHFAEDQKILSGYLILVGIWGYLIYRFAFHIGKNLFSSNDQCKITVFTGLILLGVAYFYRLIHLLIYYSNGKGIYFFELLYIILKSTCEFIIVTTLIAISWGWSITHLKHDQSYILAGVTATIINIVGLVVNGFAEEMVDTHHKYDSTSGYILQILRGFIVFIFLIGIFRTLNLSVGNIRKFIKKLALVGSLYLSSWIVVVIFAQIFLPNYMHNQVITFVEEITHIVATGMLCDMLAHPDSAYRKVSLKEEDNPLKMQNYKFR